MRPGGSYGPWPNDVGGRLFQRCRDLDRPADDVVGPAPLITVEQPVSLDIIAAYGVSGPAGRIFAFFAFFA